MLKETRMEATYNYKVVRQFAIMTVVWGIVGMLVGVIIAAQLIWPTLTEALGPLAPYLSYGRLRPLHTNAVIFAFGGSALFATSLYIVQRTCQTRLLSDGLASFVFWGWQLVILLAAVTLPMGSPPPRNMPSWNGPSTSSSPWCGWPTPCCSSAPS
jgi:cytochrome c oxidase cbb3-type subunit 1